jgi:hypothetical protein
MPAIMGCMDHLQEWAHNRLALALPHEGLQENHRHPSANQVGQ